MKKNKFTPPYAVAAFIMATAALTGCANDPTDIYDADTQTQDSSGIPADSATDGTTLTITADTTAMDTTVIRF